MESIERSQIYFVEFDPTKGREIGGGKRRPAAILSINFLNKNAGTIVVVPGTSYKPNSKMYKNHILVKPSSANGLSNETLFLCNQIRAIDKSRLKSDGKLKKPVGALQPKDLIRIEKTVMACLGLGPWN